MNHKEQDEQQNFHTKENIHPQKKSDQNVESKYQIEMKSNDGQINIAENLTAYYQVVKKKVQKHPILSLVILIGVLILILSLSFANNGDEVGANGTLEVITQFQNAILTENIEELKDLLSPDGDVEIVDEQLRNMIAEYKKDPNKLNSLVELLYAQQTLLTKNESAFTSTNLLQTSSPQQILHSGSLYLKEEEGIIFDEFKIGIRPHYIVFKVNPAKANIKMNGKKIYTTVKANETYRYGPIMPGIYKVAGSKHYPYRKIQEDQDINFFQDNQTIVNTDFELKEIKNPEPLLAEIRQFAMEFVLEILSKNPDLDRLNSMLGENLCRQDEEFIRCSAMDTGNNRYGSYSVNPSGTFHIGVVDSLDKNFDVFSSLEARLNNDETVMVRILIPPESIVERTDSLEGKTNEIAYHLRRDPNTKKLYVDGETSSIPQSDYTTFEDYSSDLSDNRIEWKTVDVSSKTSFTIH